MLPASQAEQKDLVSTVRSIDTKHCFKCDTTKPRSEFNKHSRKKDGLQTQCRSCHNAQKKVWDDENPERKKNNYLMRTYGITLGDYNDMFDEQQGFCAVCGVHQTAIEKSLVVDHCHSTGEVRGLLCNDCNMAIGKLGDNEEGLMKALTYLRKY